MYVYSNEQESYLPLLFAARKQNDGVHRFIIIAKSIPTHPFPSLGYQIHQPQSRCSKSVAIDPEKDFFLFLTIKKSSCRYVNKHIHIHSCANFCLQNKEHVRQI